jgi:predicted MFS family arabinose efflux permease
MVFFVNIPKLPETGSETEALYVKCRTGLRYIFGRREICSLIMFMAFVNFIAAIYNTLLSPLVLSRSLNNDIQLGIVSGGVGIAGLFGSIIVTRIRPVTKRVPLLLNIMTFSFLTCNGLLGIGRNYYVWTAAVFLGNLFIPLLTANVEYLMRTKIPVPMQGRVFSARNTLQYTSIPLGNLTAGYLADQVFEPFMKQASPVQRLLVYIVGSGNGNGIAFLYLCIAFAGITGCIVFRRMKSLRKLDENQEYLE